MTHRIATAALAVALGLGVAPAALAQQTVRVGVLSDMSSVYADFQGPGSVLAAQMAAEDYAKAGGRYKVEVISADHQNKPDVGASVARQWFDTQNVDMVIDLPNSAVAFAVNQIVRDKNKVLIGSGAGSAALTGAQCSPNTVHWTYDTYAYGHALGRAVVEQGGRNWFFITADYAFGHDLEKQAADQVAARGGKVVGTVRHPINAPDFSSYLLQAQSSGADVVAFANAGGDLTNALKQAAEFGLGGKQRLVGLIFGVTNVPALGLDAAKGLVSVAPFYWDRTPGTREFAQRWQARNAKKAMPNDMQAGVYAATLHYLKGVEKAGGATDGRAVVEAMKSIPTDDPLFGQGTIRADGRKMHPMYLLQVKTPAESKGPWDVMKVVGTIAAEDAFRPLNAGGCPLVK
jgi:branched-chain amino acid transport system substrate-binding protein